VRHENNFVTFSKHYTSIYRK